jgi:hypothetical protein
MFTEEVKQKMSLAKIGKSPPNKGKIGVSEETSIKMSQAAKARDPETRDCSPKTLETKIKISNTLTGKSEFEGFKAECMAKDLNCRIKNTLRARLNCAIRNSQKSGSAVSDLGCSIEDFKKYFDGLFQDGMSWDNWGKKTWHIDHILPLDSFDLSDREQLLKACHYTNLRPIWAHENSEKCGIKIPDRDLSNKTIYLISGPSGSGKTALCEALKLPNASYDKHKYGLLDLEYDTNNTVDACVRASFLADAFRKMGANVIMIYLKIPKEEILANVAKRKGHYKSVDKRIKRYEAIERLGRFDFVGSYEECKSYIEKRLGDSLVV